MQGIEQIFPGHKGMHNIASDLPVASFTIFQLLWDPCYPPAQAGGQYIPASSGL